MKARNIFSGMMGALAAVLLAATPVAAGDPVMSLQPLHPGREVVLEPEFEGEWVMADWNGKLTVTREKNFDGRELDSYRMQVDLSDEVTSFEVHLVRLRSTVFADIRQTSETGLFVLHPHVFAKIRVDCDELHFDFLHEYFVEKALESGSTDLAHEWMSSTLVLTAPTPELQDFVESYAFDDEAFGEHVNFTRMKEQPDNPKP
jgi:hypothetical protein